MCIYKGHYTDDTQALLMFSFFFSSRRRHTRFDCDWSSDVCSSDLSVSFTSAVFGRILGGNRFLKASTYELTLCISEYNAGFDLMPLKETTAKTGRSEERRVGKECRSRWSPYH